MNFTWKSFLACLIVSAAVCSVRAQEDSESSDWEELLVSGRYATGNVYVLNPSQGEQFSVQTVLVNGKEYAFNHQSNAFEVSLNQFQPNDYVVIQVQYAPSAKPVIVNNGTVMKESEFSLPSFIYNKKTKLLEWKITELDAERTYRLEQMLYGKWTVIKKLGTPDEMISNNFLPVLLSGMNMFRIVQCSENEVELSSPIVKLKGPNRRILLTTDKVKDYIEFTAVTHYELYDANGFFIKRGTAQKVSVADLKKGNYWVNFDGKEAMVTKK